MKGDDGALNLSANGPLAVKDVLNSTINTRADTHVLYTSYIKVKCLRLRHMPVQRCTSVLREIIIVCWESVVNCQTLSKDGPSQLVNNIIFFFFFSLRPMALVSYLPLSRSDVRPPRVLYIVFVFINRLFFISRDIFGFLRKE